MRAAIRQAAGRVESFSIRVDTTWAAGAGLHPAGGTGDEAQREALTRAGEARRLRFCAETRQRYAKALRAARRLHGEADEKFQAFMSRLSSAAPAHPKAPPSRVVARGGDIP